jgi:RimJ/RimL family protein N-acetyltransferase
VRDPVIVGRLVLYDDATVTQWVMQRVKGLMGREPRNLYTAIGVVNGDLNLIAGVVYHNYTGVDIEATMAADDPRWAMPGTLRALFAYPFQTVGVKRMTCMTDAPNKRCRRFLEGCGFRLEGVHPLAFDGVEAMVSYGLLEPDLIYRPRVSYGQEITEAPASS